MNALRLSPIDIITWKIYGRLTGGLLLVSLITLPLGAQQRAAVERLRPVEKSARVIERGPHHARWETVRDVTDPATGETIAITNSYVQLETGLHVQDARGQWQLASEQIEVLPGEAVARGGQHKVRWAANINTRGAIELTTPEGGIARSHVLGIAYVDPATGTSAMIADLKDSNGAVGGNQVVYQDAFDGVLADLRYTFTKAGFVQDVILREQLPDPAEFGFDPATVQVQVLTEFIQRPTTAEAAPRDPTAALLQSAGEQAVAMAEPAIQFGSMTMTQGRAFGISDAGTENAVPVRKAMELFEGGREILVERVDYRSMAGALGTLPAGGKRTASLPRTRNSLPIGQTRVAPAAPQRQWARADKPERMLAQAEPLTVREGYVIDYDLTGTTNNLTLQGDTTYYVTGAVTATGTTSIEGGTVIKFANTNNAQLKLQGAVKCLTSLYRPAVFTAKDDNIVGAAVTGSTGSPAGYYATNAVWVDNFAADLKYLQVRYAYRGVYLNWNNAAAQNLSHVQMLKCANGVVSLSPNFNLRNGLFNEVLTNFHTTGSGITGRVEHLTTDKANRLNGSGSLTLFLTNSILSAMTNSSSYTGVGSATYSDGAGVFQTLGGGNYYLAGNSTNRNVGLTNINPLLRSNYARMTTFPPQFYYQFTLTSDTTLAPLVQRDTDLPDRGYHYAALDFAVDTLSITNATLTLTNGVAIASVGPYGFWLKDYSHFVSQGGPLNPNILTDHNAVQEQPYTWNVGSSIYTLLPYRYGGVAARGNITARFTQFGGVRGQYLIYTGAANWAVNQATFQDCELFGGVIQAFGLADNPVTQVFRNNLLHRHVTVGSSACTFWYTNNTIIGGELDLLPAVGAGTTTFKDNLFHKATLVVLTNGLTASHNGFTVGSYVPELANANNKTNLTADFQAGTLGNFYLPASGTGLFLVVNAGSQNATNAGLYHFTTQTSQAKETNSVVDMGYHYVALNGSAQPVDTDGDGFADYFEDVNGDGSATGDPTSWQSYNSPNGLTGTTGLQVYTPLK